MNSNNKVFAFLAVILFIGSYFNPMHLPLAAASAALFCILRHKEMESAPGQAESEEPGLSR